MRTSRKYNTILGYTLTAIALFVLWIFIKPKAVIDPVLFAASNIDSLQVTKGDSIITIKGTRDLINISHQLKNLTPVKADRLKANKGLTFLDFFSKNKKLSFTIIYSSYDGVIFDFRSTYYKNDSLNNLIVNHLRKN